MVLGGQSLFVLEMQPASYAILATNAAEKAANIKVIDYRMIGATGRVYLAGDEAEIRNARDAACGRAGRARVRVRELIRCRSMDKIREMVRDVLAEEIGNLRRAGLIRPEQGVPRRQVREEVVSIRSDADLRAFVARLLDILKDGRSREEIEQGRWVFRLGSPAAGGRSLTCSNSAGRRCLRLRRLRRLRGSRRGVVSERQIEGLAPGTTCLIVGKSVRLTPLALDRLRMLGIAHQEGRSMITGRVKGRYWSTKRVTTLPQGALLDVELENGATSSLSIRSAVARASWC